MKEKHVKVINMKYMWDDFKWSQRKSIKGFENSNKIFYVIRRRSNNVGLFSYVHTALGHIKYAIENNYIPVIDMQNYKTPYTDLALNENAWEYYFEQPFKDYTLETIKHSRRIILSNGEPPAEYPGFSITHDKKALKEWRKLYHQYIRINKTAEHYISKLRNTLFHGERIIGVLCRGTDYTYLKPKNHPVQPEVSDVIMRTQKEMLNLHCTKVYLATEDVKIKQAFVSQFGEKLLFPTGIILPEYKGEGNITECGIDRKNAHRLSGLEYLAQIQLLSECNCFIGGACGGTYNALLMTGGFEWEYVYDLGVY